MPNDPFILFSYINTKLRDEYSSLEELCQAENMNIAELKNKLSAAGFEYNETLRKFQ